MMQLVCFDFDGTLIDSETYHATTWVAYLASWGIDMTPSDFLRQYAGVAWLRVAREFIAKYRLPMDVMSMVMEMESRTQRAFEEEPLQEKNGAGALLQVMSQVCPVAVVTGAPRDYVESVIEQQGWQDRIHLLVCGDDVANNKPSPDVYQLACRLAGCPSDKAVAVEDSQTGMMAALSAGLQTLVVADHYPFWSARAHHRFDCLDDVQPYLLQRLVGYTSLVQK